MTPHPSPHPSPFTHSGAQVGESPIWLSGESSLAWIDMPVGRIHVSSFPGGETSTVDLGRYVSAVAPRARGGWIAATWSGFAWIDPDGGIEREIGVLGDRYRMNDACCDPRGRLIAGSTHTDGIHRAGGLHLLEPDGAVSMIWDGLSLPNGMAWSPDGDTLYLADSLRSHIVALDIDARGLPRRERVLAEFRPEDGLPDGLCLDDEGCLWVAMWDGGGLIRLDPDGAVRSRLALPVMRPTSCAFGGPHGDILFVTTAIPDGSPHPLDGAVVAVRGTGACGAGRPSFVG